MPTYIKMLDLVKKHNIKVEDIRLIAEMIKEMKKDPSKKADAMKKIDQRVVRRILVIHTLECNKEDCCCKMLKQKAKCVLQKLDGRKIEEKAAVYALLKLRES
jgi:hypothetical protein